MGVEVDIVRRPFRRRVKDALLFVAAFCGVLYPIVIAYRRYGNAAPFKFFANDAFYYLNVAQRSGDTPFYTYDGAHPTNGFHPLWQWLLTFSFGHLGLHGASDGQLLADYALCAILCALGAALLALTVAHVTGSRLLALIGVVPGFYDLVMSRLSVSVVDVTETTPWSFVNGMESGLSVFFFGLFAWFLFRSGDLGRSRPPRLLLLSCLVTLMTLSRLDDVFLLIAFVGVVAATSTSNRDLLRKISLTATIPAGTIGAYLAYNLHSTGLALPVSGSAKQSGAAWLENAGAIRDTLVPSLQWSGFYWFSWDVVAWRIMQLVVPLLVACIYLVFAGATAAPSGVARKRRLAVVVLASYVVMKAAYNLLFVTLYHQGHWYFPISIEIANVIAALGVARVWSAVPTPPQRIELDPAVRARATRLLRALGAAATLVALSLMLRFVKRSHGSEVHWKPFLGASGALLVASALVASARSGGAALERIASRGALPLSAFAAVIIAVYIVLSGNAVVNQKVDGHYGDVSYDFWTARHEVDAALAAAGASGRVFELDDGIMGYALAAPTMNAMGLAVDRDASRAFRAGHCFDIAYQRGFDVLSSVTYWSYLNEQRSGFVRPQTDSEILHAIVDPESSYSHPEDCDRRGFTFSVLRSMQIGRHSVYFLEFKPRTGQPEVTVTTAPL